LKLSLNTIIDLNSYKEYHNSCLTNKELMTIVINRFGNKGIQVVNNLKNLKQDIFDIKLEILKTQRIFWDFT